MIKRSYITKNFSADNTARIETANKIIDEYLQAGYSLSLRQLYYQFVARGLLENSERSYKSLGSLISDARMAGLVAWDAIDGFLDLRRYAEKVEQEREAQGHILGLADSLG